MKTEMARKVMQKFGYVQIECAECPICSQLSVDESYEIPEPEWDSGMNCQQHLEAHSNNERKRAGLIFRKKVN